MRIKAIETAYNGYKFRSRLEAKWAKFFDEMGIDYQYESEGYVIDEVRYLPDFYILPWEIVIEIKPPNGDFRKALMLARDEFTCRVFVVSGEPRDGRFKIIMPIEVNHRLSDDGQIIAQPTNYKICVIDGVFAKGFFAKVARLCSLSKDLAFQELRFDVEKWRDSLAVLFTFNDNLEKVTGALLEASGYRFGGKW